MGQYRHAIESNTEFTLGWALDFTESDFCEDFAEVWGLEAPQPPTGVDHEDWVECRRVYGLANQIAAVAQRLVRQKGLGPQRLAMGEQLGEEARRADQLRTEVLTAVGPQLEPPDLAKLREVLDWPSADDPRSRYSIFVNAIEIAVGAILPRRGEVALRAQSLVRYVVRSQNDRVNAFLNRVATCYLLDLRTELAVMARAVLGAALEEVAPDVNVRDALKLRKSERVGLGTRFQHMDTFDLVDRRSREAMDRLKLAGDEAAHGTPGLEPDPDAIMADLLAALTALDGLRTRV